MGTTLSAKPLRDTRADARLFVDRSHELDRVSRSLRADLNVLLLGTRGSGRTTFLRHLAYRLRTEWKQPYVYIEAGHAEDARSFLSLLRWRLLADERTSVGEAAASAIGSALSVSRATPRHATEELLSLYAEIGEAARRKPG